MHETNMHFCDSVIITCEHLHSYQPSSQPAGPCASSHYYPFCYLIVKMSHIIFIFLCSTSTTFFCIKHFYFFFLKGF